MKAPNLKQSRPTKPNVQRIAFAGEPTKFSSIDAWDSWALSGFSPGPASHVHVHTDALRACTPGLTPDCVAAARDVAAWVNTKGDFGDETTPAAIAAWEALAALRAL